MTWHIWHYRMDHEVTAVVGNNQARHTGKVRGGVIMTYLKWEDGKQLTMSEIKTITGLDINREAIRRRLRKAKSMGIPVDTLAEQIRVLVLGVDVISSSAQSVGATIPLDVDANEARRLKTIRETLLIDEKRKQAEIETQLKRKEVFYLDAIEPAWSAMVISIREALRGMMPTLVDKVLPCETRDEAVDRAEDELARHLYRLSEFDLVRELNEHEGIEGWEFTQTDST